MKKLTLLFCILFLLGTLCLPSYAADDYEMLQNGDFEEMTSTWQKYYMATVDYCDQAHSGSSALKITNRQHSTDIARQYITKPLEHYGPGSYEFSAWVRLADPSDAPINLQVAIGVYCKNGTNLWFTSDWVSVTSEWTYIHAIRPLSWSGELDTAEFYLVSPMNGDEDTSKNFRDLILDDCSMKPVDFTGEPYEQPTTEAPTTEPPTTEAPTTEPPATEAPTTEEIPLEEPTTQAPEDSADPEQSISSEEQESQSEQSGGIRTQTWIFTGTMIATGLILLACAIALTVSYVRGKRNEASK